MALVMTPFSLRAKSELIYLVRRKRPNGQNESFVSPPTRTIENTDVKRAERGNSDSHDSSLKDSPSSRIEVSQVSSCSREKMAGGNHPMFADTFPTSTDVFFLVFSIVDSE